MRGYRKSPPEVPGWVYGVGIIVVLVFLIVVFQQ